MYASPPLDYAGPSQQVWYIKCRALTQKMYIDDTDIEEEGVADMLLDENAMAQLPRCVSGTPALPWRPSSNPSDSSLDYPAAARPPHTHFHATLTAAPGRELR